MATVIPFFLGGGFLISVFIIVHMILTASRRSSEELFLGIVLFLCGVNLIHPHLNMVFPEADMYGRFRLFEPMHYLIAPLLYLYIRNIGNERLDLGFKDLAHAVLPLFVIVFSYSPAVGLLETLSPLPLSSLLFWIILVVQSFGYMHAATRRLTRIRIGLLELFSNLKDRSPDWLVWIMRLFFILNMSYLLPVIFLLHISNPGISRIYLSISSFILIWVIGLKAAGSRAGIPAVQKKINHGGISLSKDDIKLITDALEEQLTVNRLYRNPDLSLDDLVKILGFSRNEVSWVINNEIGCNFYRFINEYRVNEVMERLGGIQNGTILDIAFRAGFNSKPVFNRVFKEITGVTPSLYKRQHRKR